MSWPCLGLDLSCLGLGLGLGLGPGLMSTTILKKKMGDYIADPEEVQRAKGYNRCENQKYFRLQIAKISETRAFRHR